MERALVRIPVLVHACGLSFASVAGASDPLVEASVFWRTSDADQIWSFATRRGTRALPGPHSSVVNANYLPTIRRPRQGELA